MKRKEFLQLVALAGLAPVSFYCTPKNNAYSEKDTGPDSKTGHLLQDKKAATPSKTSQKKILILGGGISGLTTAYTLKKNGIDDFLLLELEKEVGGNSSYRTNEVSNYPLGAHYLPIPNLNQKAMISFLKDVGIITDFDKDGKPIYKEEYLCQEPEERLFIKNYWQNGLVPEYSVPEKDKKEIADFFALMKFYQNEIGSDRKEAFCIPVAQSSTDKKYLDLDHISFKEFIEQKTWKSEYLHWYIDYCLRDDFGCSIAETSAWMGIHYFASRKGISANADKNDVLTWPEGNGKLMDELRKTVVPHIEESNMAVQVDTRNNGFDVLIFNANSEQYEKIECEQLVLAVPQFICARILPSTITHPISQKMDYSPWLIANLTVKPFDTQQRGQVLSWDNVIYGSEGLGYVNACHQHLKTVHEKYVFTYYRPLLEKSPSEMRKTIRNWSNSDWKKLVLDDLKTAHPTIEQSLEHIEIFTTGHSMPQPKIGLMKKVLAQNQEAQTNVYFAHSDRSGYSIFEEAFYWGNLAAEKIIEKIQA